MGLGGLPAPGGERTGPSAYDKHGESPWVGLRGLLWTYLSLTQGSLSDTLMPAHALGKGRSFFVELRLGVCDHDFQPKQPSWVLSEWRDWQGSPECDHELWAQLRRRARDIGWS